MNVHRVKQDRTSFGPGDIPTLGPVVGGGGEGEGRGPALPSKSPRMTRGAILPEMKDLGLSERAGKGDGKGEMGMELKHKVGQEEKEKREEGKEGYLANPVHEHQQYHAHEGPASHSHHRQQAHRHHHPQPHAQHEHEHGHEHGQPPTLPSKRHQPPHLNISEHQPQSQPQPYHPNHGHALPPPPNAHIHSPDPQAPLPLSITTNHPAPLHPAAPHPHSAPPLGDRSINTPPPVPAKGALMSRIKASIFQREPLAKTWAKRSFVEELESVGPSSPTRSNAGGFAHGMDMDLESQGQGGVSYPSFAHPHPRARSVYASPIAMARFRSLPPFNAEGENVVAPH